MTVNKSRIPRLATAALLLGGACGDGGGKGTASGSDAPGGTTEGIDRSSSRVDALSRAFCKQLEECDADYFNEYYSDQADCTSYNKDWWTHSLSDENADCADAELDELACKVQLSCTEDESKCKEFEDAVDELCPNEDYDYTSSSRPGSVGGLARARALLRTFRIPR